MTPELKIKDLLLRVVQEIALRPDDVKINTVKGDSWTSLSIECHPHDTGKLIGKGGAHFKALKILFSVMGANTGRRVHITDLEMDRIDNAERYGRFEPAVDWNRERIIHLLDELCQVAFKYGAACKLRAVDDLKHPKTLITISLPSNEPHSRQVIFSALEVLMNAIGRKNGRMLMLDMDPTLEAEHEQPESADGRHMKEILR